MADRELYFILWCLSSKDLFKTDLAKQKFISYAGFVDKCKRREKKGK